MFLKWVIKENTGIKLKINNSTQFNNNLGYLSSSFCCGSDSMIHFLLVSRYNKKRLTFLSTIKNIVWILLEKSDSALTEILLFVIYNFDLTTNTPILNAAIQCILETKRCYCTLFFSNNSWSAIVNLSPVTTIDCLYRVTFIWISFYFLFTVF